MNHMHLNEPQIINNINSLLYEIHAQLVEDGRTKEQIGIEFNNILNNQNINNFPNSIQPYVQNLIDIQSDSKMQTIEAFINNEMPDLYPVLPQQQQQQQQQQQGAVGGNYRRKHKTRRSKSKKSKKSKKSRKHRKHH